MISEVGFESSTFKKNFEKMETGTPNISAILGLGEAIKYVQEIGISKILEFENILSNYFLEKIKNLKNFTFFCNLENKNKVPIFSFSHKIIHSHDVSQILDNEKIVVRSGHHCAMPLHTKILKIPSTTRISFSFYNTKSEIDKIIEVLKTIDERFKNGKFL